MVPFNSVNPTHTQNQTHSHVTIILQNVTVTGGMTYSTPALTQRGESSWSGPWHLGCTSGSFPCAQLPGPVHIARLGRVCFSILSLAQIQTSICMTNIKIKNQFKQFIRIIILPVNLLVHLSICAFWYVCLSPFFWVSLDSWVISLTVLGASVTNLNEPPRA